MKKATLIIAVIMILSVLTYADSRFMVSVSGNLLMPSDEDFKVIYSSSVIYPEVKAGLKIYDNLYAWSAYGFFKKDGVTPVLDIEVTSTQNFLSFGAGYLVKLTEKLSLDIAAGLASISYKEEAMGIEISGSKMGFQADAGICLTLWEGFFTILHAGYIGAKDTVNSLEVNLGGIQFGIGIGIFF